MSKLFFFSESNDYIYFYYTLIAFVTYEYNDDNDDTAVFGVRFILLIRLCQCWLIFSSLQILSL